MSARADYGTAPLWATSMTDEQLERFARARVEEIERAQAAVEHQQRVIDDRRRELRIVAVVRAIRRVTPSPTDGSAA